MKVKESLQVLAAALMVLALAGYASAASTSGVTGYSNEPSQMPKKPDCKKTPNDPACKDKKPY